MNQMSTNLFSKHLLEPECRQSAKGHLDSRAKMKISHSGVCPPCLFTPNSSYCYYTASDGECREHRIQSPQDCLMLTFSSDSSIVTGFVLVAGQSEEQGILNKREWNMRFS